MTYRQYLESCDDEFERTIIIANLARKHPNYSTYSERRKKRSKKRITGRGNIGKHRKGHGE